MVICVKWKVYKSSAVAEMDDRARAKWAEKWGLLCPLSAGELDSHLTQCRLGRGVYTSVASGILINLAVWSEYTYVTDRQD